MKIKNVTTAKTQQGNNVKPQFKIRHICYYSWELTQEDVDSISNSLRNCISSGDDFVEPLGGDPKKVVEWEDTSNLPPQKVSGNTLQQNRNNTNNTRNNNPIKENRHMKQTIKLTESELRNMITESVRKIIKEAIVPKACAYCGNPIKQGDNYCSKCGANIQEMVNKHNAWLQQNPNVNSEPMVWGQQSQQPMQQQQQPMQQPPQQRQQPTSTNNNTMIDNQVQQQMQRNMGLQQKMANKIRQQKMTKFN